MRPPRSRRPKNRQFPVLARPAGSSEGSLRRGGAKELATALVRSPEACAVVYFLGRRSGLCSHSLLWPSAECGGGIAGVSRISKSLKVDFLRGVAVDIETRTLSELLTFG
jgi:hypothetical protein